MRAFTWHHQLNGHQFEEVQELQDVDRSSEYRPWGRTESQEMLLN